ncbi:nitrate ABC transporter substrate-binding protein [Nocardiopsis nanhaiensis]
MASRPFRAPTPRPQLSQPGTSRPRTLRPALLAASALSLSLLLTGCIFAEDSQESAELEPVAADQRLDDVCPATVVVQLQWEPETDSGPLFGLLGPGYTVDAETGSVSGPLAVDGLDTGVDLEIRAGGPAIGFQTVPSQMYVDEDITLGLAHSEQAIAAAGSQPVTAVSTLLRGSAQMLMWDPQTHPDWAGVADIQDSGAPVVVSQGQLYPDWLVAEGLLDADQIDTSYDNSPARFTADPTFAQQGFANSEPFVYENEVSAWNRPVAYELIRDLGYEGYARTVTVRSDRVDELSPCLELLVPMVQQATADFHGAPEPVNDTVVDVVAQNPNFNPYSAELAAYSSETLLAEGLIGDETDGTVGSFDLERVQRVIDDFAPLLRDGGSDVPEDLAVDDLVNTDFLDPGISVGE